MPKKTAFYATVASMLMAASHGYAQSNKSVTLGFMTTAETLDDGGNRLTGAVSAECKGGQGLGWRSGHNHREHNQGHAGRRPVQ